NMPARSSLVTAKPVRLLTVESVDDEPPAWQSRDWSAVLARLSESDAVGIDAHGQMTDAMIDDLSKVEHLETLRLGGSRGVTDVGVSHLARLPGLRHIDLSGTGVTDKGLEVVLRALPALESVSLAWTQVTDTGLAHLSGCQRLSEVNLLGTSSGDGVLRAL